MNSLSKLGLAALLVAVAVPALADEHGMQGMQNMPCMNMMGMHEMSVSVTAVDAKTGVVNGDSGGMKLTLHFPPASLAGVKPGDTINVHLGFSK